MEQVAGIEPALSAWQAEVLTAILYLHGISDARAGRALLCTTTPESGAGNRSRTCNLLVTNQLRCQLRHTGILVSRGFEPLNAYLLRSNAGTLNYLGSAPETMDRDTGFEPAPSAWKAEMLAANTNPG